MSGKIWSSDERSVNLVTGNGTFTGCLENRINRTSPSLFRGRVVPSVKHWMMVKYILRRISLFTKIFVATLFYICIFFFFFFFLCSEQLRSVQDRIFSSAFEKLFYGYARMSKFYGRQIHLSQDLTTLNLRGQISFWTKHL